MYVGPSVGHTFFTAGVKRNSITHDHLSSCIEWKDSNASGVVTITKEVATIFKLFWANVLFYSVLTIESVFLRNVPDMHVF